MKRLACIAMSLALAGCCCFMFQGDPYYDDYTRVEPASADLVGVWTANAKSLDWLKGQGYAVAAAPTLELKADGTFAVTGMPDCWRVFADTDRTKTFDSAPGKWKVAKHQEWWAVALDFDRPPWYTQGGYSTEVFLRRQAPPYLLHVIVGDPDAGNGIEFEKP